MSGFRVMEYESTEYWDWVHSLEAEVGWRGLKASVTLSYREFDIAIVKLNIWRVTQDTAGTVSRVDISLVGEVEIGYVCGWRRSIVVSRPEDEIRRELEAILGHDGEA